ncbi:hypothetical protein ESCO_004172 [Escovopsis weberi]|uniref:Uncharacterized protein n=1 Tax=Escovopsis weberi TaxID=150374 RepID=A0A0M8N6N0_ESCWE|nr:hypothetical protein ESCO_004172 [Escovopsis weberi]
MPRQGDGSSDNGPFDMDHHIIHGTKTTDEIYRKHKTAELPEGIHEKGAGQRAKERNEQILREAEKKGLLEKK